LDSSEFESLVRAAGDEIADELAHHRGGGVIDPSLRGASVMSSSCMESLKRRHAFLNEYDDEVLASTPLSVLVKLESTSLKIKNVERQKDAEDRLSANRESLGIDKIQVAGGIDDRWDNLHEGRFLPGAACSMAKMWNKGREYYKKADHKPINIYDMAAVGLAGHVTPKGWVVLSDPGDSRISINLFSIANCGKRSTSKSSGYLEEELKEVAELGELKVAVRVLREALSMVHSWNKSVSVLEGFLIQTNWCSKDLEGLENQAGIMVQFVDYVLRENSNRWRSKEPFIPIGELKGVWESFFGSRPQSLLSRAKPKQTYQKQGASNNNNSWSKHGSSSQDGKIRPGWVPPEYFKDDICVMYNLGKCVKPPGTCTTSKGVPLRHICNFRADPSKHANYCGQNHMSKLYH